MVNLSNQIRILAKNKARQSLCRNRVSALGFNKNGDCVIKTFNKHRFERKGGGIHAEMQIMQQARKKGIVHIIICRVGRNGDLLPIEPCKKCQQIADKLEITISSVPKEE